MNAFVRVPAALIGRGPWRGGLMCHGSVARYGPVGSWPRLAALVTMSTAHADAPAPLTGAIVTERPSFSTSPQVLPAGRRWRPSPASVCRPAMARVSATPHLPAHFSGPAADAAGEGIATASTADVGVAWLLEPNLQIDAVVGIGLSDRADDGFIGAGIAYRW